MHLTEDTPHALTCAPCTDPRVVELLDRADFALVLIDSRLAENDAAMARARELVSA